MLTIGNQDTQQNSVSNRTWSGAVATVRLVRNDRWANHMLGQIVRGIQFVDIQETQHMWTMLTQTLGKAGIVKALEIEAKLALSMDVVNKLSKAKSE
jgi:hypothetical protein